MATKWITTEEAAQYLPGRRQGTTLHPAQVRRNAVDGKYGEIKRGISGRNGKAIFVEVRGLPLDGQANFFAAHPHLAPKPLIDADELPPPIFNFDNATGAQRRRAATKHMIVVAYELWLAANTGRRGLMTTLTNAWIREFCESHPDDVQPFSLDSLQRWRKRYAAFGRDGLIDGNDGHGRRGKSVIHPRVEEFFLETIKAGETNIAEATELARDWAKVVAGIEVAASDSAFKHAAKTKITSAQWRILEDPDNAETRVFGTTRRDHQFPALKIVQADHHQADVWVSCDGTICGAEYCIKAHRPWLTVFIDVASRAILSAKISLQYPNADRVLEAFRDLVEKWGLPDFVYVDNGKDFTSAFGRAIRRGEALAINEGYLNNLLASVGVRAIFAIKYRARSKGIERLFRTWVEQIWKGSPAYVGALGKRTDHARALQLSPLSDEVPTFAAFAERMSIEIDRYNLHKGTTKNHHARSDGHRGQGMNGRSPMMVIAETRIPLRRPEPFGWALAFHKWYARVVQAGGVVQVGQNRYQLDATVWPSLLGRQVQLLVDPTDVRRATVASACKHMTSQVARTKALECGCPNVGAFLCEASLWGLSTYDTHDAITQENLRAVATNNREARALLRTTGSMAARAELSRFRRDPLSVIRTMRDADVAANRDVMAKAVGAESAATTVLLPQSSIAQKVRAYRTVTSTSRRRLSDEERRIADTAVVVTPSFAAWSAPEDADERTRRERESRGMCSATPDCPLPGAPFCAPHRIQLLGDGAE